jgi:hypothetical protein
VSLKGVELQIAIPKTFDAGKMADQHQQNTINQQYNANEALKREIERKQFAVNESDHMDAISEDEEKGQSADSHSSTQQKKKKKQQLEQKAQHPFKGNFFDFSG